MSNSVVHPEKDTDVQRVPVAGGVLVFEPCDIGKRLVDVENVTDADAVRDALRARGLGHGAVDHYR